MKPSKKLTMGFGIAIAALLSNALANWHGEIGSRTRSNSSQHVPMTSPSTVASREMATLPAGTKLAIRLINPISPERNPSEVGFTAELYGPLIVDNNYLARSRSEILGQIERPKASGPLVEHGDLIMVLQKLIVDGYEYDLETEPVLLVSEGSADRPVEDAGANDGADELMLTILGRNLRTDRPLTATYDHGLAYRFAPQLTFTLSSPAELPVIRRMGTTTSKENIRSSELLSEFRKTGKRPAQERE